MGASPSGARGGRLSCRPVEERDYPVICGFVQSPEELFFMFPAARYPLTPEQLREAVARRADSTVVELDGETVAFANFHSWATGGRCTLGNVIVAPGARGSGVGRYLVEQMLHTAFTRHAAAEVTAACFHNNLAGLLFYPRLGFQPYALEERQDPQGRPTVLIHLRLTRPAP